MTDDNKIGLLIVGLGGGNGVTLLAGHIANKKNLNWETPTGATNANWNGCITQIPPRGVHGGVGFKGRYEGLASAANAEIGGWDIRSTPLGDALYESHVLEYDLVRQVRDEMNAMTDTVLMKGMYNASFLGESQYDTATHIVESTGMTFREQVEYLRNDIREFIKSRKVTGHTTVIWSASVERPSEVELDNADELLEALDDANNDVSPSMLYAIAAAMEGCSFVNGGSQNTLSPGMSQLYETTYRSNLESFPNVSTTAAYLLGTDFKAGQTKFKTAAVEYIRTLGLQPKVIASSNHLGNNDMLNLTSKKTVTAKLRVKSNIFGPWEEDQLDHQVKVMYTPYMGDEKRDVVEYTSFGFLNKEHTMLTYTRCMDSILCVPLMVDAAVWCDYFFNCEGASPVDVARATAYLFKVPEGGAKGVDPGFFAQMKTLEQMLQKLSNKEGQQEEDDLVEQGVKAGIITQEQAVALRALSK